MPIMIKTTKDMPAAALFRPLDSLVVLLVSLLVSLLAYWLGLLFVTQRVYPSNRGIWSGLLLHNCTQHKCVARMWNMY